MHVPGGGLCRCGARGCIEAYAGFYAMLRTAFDVPLDTIPAKFVPIAELDKIATSARQGGRRNVLAFRQAGLALGNGLSRVLSLHERMPIVITGPGVRYYDLLIEGITEGLAESHVVRMEGMPELRVIADEPTLVFEGHLNRAFSIIDNDIVKRGASVVELRDQAG
jgi:predicted NBD/HSP70 family sugar kinase